MEKQRQKSGEGAELFVCAFGSREAFDLWRDTAMIY